MHISLLLYCVLKLDIIAPSNLIDVLFTAAFIDMPELLQYLKGNYTFWKEKEAQGITSIQDFVTVQDTIQEHEEPVRPAESSPAAGGV